MQQRSSMANRKAVVNTEAMQQKNLQPWMSRDCCPLSSCCSCISESMLANELSCIPSLDVFRWVTIWLLLGVGELIASTCFSGGVLLMPGSPCQLFLSPTPSCLFLVSRITQARSCLFFGRCVMNRRFRTRRYHHGLSKVITIYRDEGLLNGRAIVRLQENQP
jgi:hypothetical protein